jgi:penicillin-binding protein 1A
MGTGTKAAIAGWPAGGKTGTSQDYRDAWFLGYTANLTAGVWVGNDSNAPMKRVFGGTLPAAIWSSFMTKAHEGVPVAELPGTELIPTLLAQPAPDAGTGGWGVAQVDPIEQADNEARMRDWILNRDGSPQPVRQQQPVEERRGFFRRLFGG